MTTVTVYINLHKDDIPIKSQCLIAFSISGNRSLNVDLKTSTIISIKNITNLE